MTDTQNPFASVGYAEVPSASAAGGADSGSAGASQSNANPFAAVGYVDHGESGDQPKQHAATAGSLFANFAAGTNEGISGILGAPVDALTFMANNSPIDLAVSGARRLLGVPFAPDDGPQPRKIVNPVGGSDWIKAQEAKVGMSPDQVQAQNEAERVARGAGVGVASTILPAAGAEALVSRVAMSALGRADAMNATIGAAAGAGGQAAQDVAPEPYKPIAGLVGGLAAGALPVGAYGVGLAARSAAQHLPPMTAAGREAAAQAKVGGEIASAAGGPSEVRAALADSPDTVPGSQGTMAQRVPALSQWEDSVRTANKGPFIERAAQQNAARVNELGAIQPEGAAQQLPEGLRGQQAAVDAATQARVETAQNAGAANRELADTVTGANVAAAQQAHQSALESLRTPPQIGSPSDAAAYFRNVRNAIEQDSQSAVEHAQGKSAAAVAGVKPSADNPEQLGAATRNPAAAALAARKEADNALYEAAKIPDNATVPASGITKAVNDVKAEMTPESKPLSGEEKRLFDLAGSYGTDISFNRLRTLRSAILDESSATRINDPAAYRRLQLLRGPVENAMDHAVENQAALESISGNRGLSPSEDTISSRVGKLIDERAGKNAELAQARAGSVGPGAGAGEAGNAGVSANEGAARGGPGTVAGAEGVRPGTGPESGSVGSVGNTGSVHYPGGSVDVRYEVVNHPDLVTSHDTNFNPRADYPQSLQPRNRSSAAGQDQVVSTAARLNPERLGRSSEANSGAPIIGPDNVVESGNGRTMAIGRAYDSGRGEEYRKWLESQGFDTTGIDKPVLVARRVTPLDAKDREYFAHASNSSTGLRMSAAEQATTDAKFLTPEMLGAIRNGGLADASNRDFVRGFLAKLPAAERGGFVDKAGEISQQGARRLDAAIASKAYGSDGFVSRAFDSYDPNIRSVAGGMTDAAGSWAKMREAAQEGRISADHDVTPQLMDAVSLIQRARDNGTPIANLIDQKDMFGAAVPSLVRRLLLRDDGLVASREMISENLRRYADEALKNEAGPRLFGQAMSPQDILKAALGKRTEEGASSGFQAGASEAPIPQNIGVSAEQVAALKKANASYREQRQLYGEGPIGEILQKQPRGNDFRLSDAEVPAKIFHKGPTGAEDVRSYVSAVGPEKATPVLNDLAAFMLNEKGFDNGVPNPAKISRWLDDHKAALSELPAETRAKFETVASAQKAVDDAIAARTARLREFDQTAAARVAGLDKPSDIVDTVGGLIGRADGTKQMSELAARAKGDTAAENGLKQAVVQHVLSKFVPDVSTPRIDAMRDFLSTNRETLQASGLTPGDIAALDANAVKLARAQLAMKGAESDRSAAMKAVEGESKASVKAAEASRKVEMSPFENGIVGRLVHAQSTSDILDAIRGAFQGSNPTERMAELAQRANGIDGGPSALKKAIMQMVEREYTSTVESGATGIGQLKGANFAKFVRDKADVMKAAGLSDEQVGRLSAIVQDQQRSARSIYNAKLSGQSNSTPDAINAMKQGTIMSALMHGNDELAGAVLGHAAHGLSGTIAGMIGAKALGALREAGLTRLNEIRLQAVLDPEGFGKALLEKVPQKPDTGGAALLALRARQLAIAGSEASQRRTDQ